MTRSSRLLPLAAFVVATGAKPNEVGQFLVAGGIAAALLVALGLPVGLLVHGVRRDFVASQARAVERRATACVMIGAGLVVATAFVVAVLASRAPGLAAAAIAAASAWFFVGFAGCARLHGARMLAPGDSAESPRPLVLGWLARAGLFAVPVAWPFLGTYLVVVAFGAPVVALLDRQRPAAPVTS
jgi:hypothetical protein